MTRRSPQSSDRRSLVQDGEAKDSPPRSSPWLYGPTWDLAMGAGAWSVPLLAITYYLNQSQLISTALLFYALSLFCNNPHYMATLHRAYGLQEDRQKYRFFTAYITGIILLAGACIFFVPRLLPWLITIYITWSPWHYSGQNFGIAMLFLRRGQVSPTKPERNLLWLSFVCSYLIWLVSISTEGDRGPYFLSLGLPWLVSLWVRALLLIGWVGCVIYSMWSLSARVSWRVLGTAFTVMATQFIWFVLPSFLELMKGMVLPPAYFASGALAFMHCAQYLWITSYYARQRAQSGTVTESTGNRWSFARYYWLMVLGGIALFVPGPWLISMATGRDFVEIFLIVTALVNIHHFMVDGAVWKLRDGRLAQLLRIQNAPLPNAGQANAAVPPDAPARFGQWLRRHRVVYKLAGATVVAVLCSLVVLDQWQYYTVSSTAAKAVLRSPYGTDTRVLLRQAKAKTEEGNLADAVTLLNRAVALNPRSEAQYMLGASLVAKGDLDKAREHYRNQPAFVQPDAASLINYGSILAQKGDYKTALAILQKSVKWQPENLLARRNLAEAYMQSGLYKEAVDAYELWLSTKADQEGEAALHSPDAISVFLSAGIANQNLGDTQSARRIFEEAKALAGKLGQSALEAQADSLLQKISAP